MTALRRGAQGVRPRANRGTLAGPGIPVPPVPAAALPPASPVATILRLSLVALLATSLIALPLGGSQVAFAFFVLSAVHALMLWHGRLVLDRGLLLLCLVMLLLATLGQAVAVEFSITSFLFVILIYAPLCFRIRVSRDEYERVLNMVLALALAVAGTVFLQHASQALGGPFFDVKSMLPQSLIYETYVYRQPIVWGQRFDKPNGILLLEASFTSQVIALGLVVEWIGRQRALVLAFLATALLATFAGTGLLLLLLVSPFLLARLNPRLAVVPLLLLAPAAVILVQAGLADVILKRLGDFGTEGTSANSRFVVPFSFLYQFFANDDLLVLLLGKGAGGMPETMHALWWPSSKFLGEYGLLSFVTFMAFNLRWLLAGRPNAMMAWSTVWVYHVLNGSLLVPFVVGLVHLASAAYRIEEEAPARSKVAPTKPLASRTTSVVRGSVPDRA